MKVVLLNQIPEVNNKYTFSLAKAIQSNGVDIKVCGIADDDVSAYNVPFLNLFSSYSKEKGILKKIISYYKSYKRLEKYCIEEKIDILHTQWYIFSPLDYLFIKKIKRNGTKIVTTIHDLLPFNKKIYDYHYHKKIYRMADAVVNQARSNEKELIEKFKVKKNNIIYTPHGHYMEYAEKATREESREYLEIPPEKKVILFFGQIKKVKGIDVLIEALKDVVSVHNDVICVIAGKVWKDDFTVYDDMIQSYGLQDYVSKFIRYIDDSEIKYFFNAADVVALPYRQIYQSGVVLLAYAYEKPVVATREGEFITVVKDNETGKLVEAGNSKELADAINWYLDNLDKANEFGRAGKEDLMVRLSWDTIAQKVTGRYRQILG